MKNVAKLAGVSVSTVSRYLNDHPYIAEGKRESIKKAMKELDYVPSSVATQLRSKKGTMIGVLVSRITNPFFSYLIDTIEKQARLNGYSVLIIQTYDDREAEIKILEMLKQKVISGLIMCSVENTADVIDPYQKYGPIVLCNERLEGSKLPKILTDQEKATYEAIHYLIEKGNQRIAYCTGGSFLDTGHGSSRNRGFKAAMEANNLLIKDNLIFRDMHTIDDGRKVAAHLLQEDTTNFPEAVFAGSDEVASGMVEVFLAKGKRVPEDVAVMGFDNQPFASMVSVPLTTVEQPVHALGEEATKLMLHLLNGQAYEINHEQLNLTIVKRESA
ncbi:LacI family DNA-binding transcriptional regulator [Marinilactibacillus sp. XAAS-LB27]|uniref:LacI family DNA-binding transcriptional regulator n=1 Tax=Marinilactibacillus sp. XAAS-LB27 TaxID=3114538 RepID=UPI002E19FDEE|nr:LacI family DNA-binding transcriptional regulator [Marinilactibacillus sp. XAAS-LB27]